MSASIEDRLSNHLPHERDVGHAPVASRQDVLEAFTGCLIKDVLETSLQENVRLKGCPGGLFTSLPRSGLRRASSKSRSWHSVMLRLSSTGFRPR